MNFRGGYNILLSGRPDRGIKVMPEPKTLYLPLSSRRFTFSEVCVEDGQSVNSGDTLAKDPNNFAVPLLAPRGGTVRLDNVENHIVLQNVRQVDESAPMNAGDLPHIAHEAGTSEIKCHKLLTLGAWQFFYDAHTGALPDPLATPQAVIVSTLSLEPFLVRGDAQLHDRLLNFTRGLEQLQSLLEYQPIYLVMPDIRSELANLVHNQIRGHAWVKMLQIPLTYPYDNFRILARRLGLRRGNGPVWAVRAEGVLAVDNVLTLGKPCIVRIISIGGAAVNSPTHLKVMPGYPTKKITDEYLTEPAARLINGGILTGQMSDTKMLGLDTECRGITVLPELKEREFLGFIRPGWDRSCYAQCFLSSLRKKFRERFTTGMRGERRPCVACNFCEEVCPAGIMPHFIHKFLYHDDLDEVERARVDLCVECGLCSFVCPSKIDLMKEFIEAKALIEKEKEEIRQEQARKEKEMAKEQTE